jgi:hypothetical protein
MNSANRFRVDALEIAQVFFKIPKSNLSFVKPSAFLAMSFTSLAIATRSSAEERQPVL